MPVPKHSTPIARHSMREEVYNALLGWIMEGVLRPGEKILDKDLAERLGVSRTPVREAIRRLEDKGLIESEAHKWTRVAKISIGEPLKIYPIIWSLEELALTQVFDILGPDDITEMASLNRALAQAINSNNAVNASLADGEFHRIFIEKTNNNYLIQILQDLKIASRRVELCYFGGCACALESVEEHHRLLTALEDNDLPSALQSIRNNWQNSLDRLQNADQQQRETNLASHIDKGSNI